MLGVTEIAAGCPDRLRQHPGLIFEHVDAKVHLQPRETLVGHALFQPVAEDLRVIGLGCVRIATHGIAELATEQLVRGHVIDFACDVPQSHFNAAHTPALTRGTTKLFDLPENLVDAGRVLAEQLTLQHQRIVFARAITDFTKSVHSLICVDAYDRASHWGTRDGGDPHVGNLQFGRFRVGINMRLPGFELLVCPEGCCCGCAKSFQHSAAARRTPGGADQLSSGLFHVKYLTTLFYISNRTESRSMERKNTE